MEISSVRKGNSISVDRKKVNTKKSFSQSFDLAKERRNEDELKKSLEEIKKKGNRLSITKCYSDVKEYKRLIQEYLKEVLKYMCSVNKAVSFWQTQYFITVDTIDAKLRELTELLLSEEQENLKVAATIEEIQGLIIDIYK
ncbi:MAG: YaaR family protein [Clostridiaceae bacterium]